MGGHVASGEDASVHLRVQGFDPAVEHLGKARHLGHIENLHPRVPEELGRAARGQDLHPEVAQAPRELHHPRLVVHAQERALHSAHGLSLMWTLRPSMLSRPSAKRRTASG
jgi:hypothetical protein